MLYDFCIDNYFILKKWSHLSCDFFVLESSIPQSSLVSLIGIGIRKQTQVRLHPQLCGAMLLQSFFTGKG